MKLAVMQPYLFPYIGYFQLINSVDKFVFYDDVNFIKQGWINRNSILVGGKALLFTVPLENQSSFKKINETFLSKKIYPSWADTLLKTIEQNYKKAPFFNEVYPLLKRVFQAENQSIASLAVFSIKSVADYVGITTELIDSSMKYNNHDLSSQARVLDICRQEKASQYINLSGGMTLYSKSDFLEKGIELQFIQSEKIAYAQFNDNFVSNLSIIDILMFNDVSKIKDFLNHYNLQ
jgi:hypothetical protein